MSILGGLLSMLIPRLRRAERECVRLSGLLAAARSAAEEAHLRHQQAFDESSMQHAREITDLRAKTEVAESGRRETLVLLEEHTRSRHPAPSKCLQGLGAESLALFTPPGHFYSPLLDPGDSAVQRAMDHEAAPSSPLTEFGISEREVLSWFDRVSANYDQTRGKPQPFPKHAETGWRYHFDNPAFPLADALALLTFMTVARPKRYLEIGAGHSSCAALDISERYLSGQVEMFFVDPHPETFHQLLIDHPDDRRLILQARLQDVPLDRFRALEAGDILFIDSSHVAKTGSDVLDYLFRVLPALRPGVYVHIHDIFFPFEYPRAWIVDENRSWNEAYILRAFLQGNPRFEVLYLSDWIFKCRRELLATRMPLCVQYRGASLWMRSR